MMPSTNELNQLWEFRANTVLRSREPGFAIQGLVAGLLLQGLPIMVSGLSRTAILLSGIAAAVYGAYALAAFVIWRHYKKNRRHRNRIAREKLATVFVLGNDGLALLFMSITCLAAGFYALEMLTSFGFRSWIIFGTLWLCFALGVYVFTRGPHFVKDVLTPKDINPIFTRLAMAQGALISCGVGSGVLVGVAAARVNIGDNLVGLIIFAVTLLLTCIMLPIASIALYQVFVLAIDGMRAARKVPDILPEEISNV